MSTSLLLNTASLIKFDISGSKAEAPISAKTASLSGTYTGIITWDFDADAKNTILGSNVVIKIKDINIPAVTDTYVNPLSSATGEISGSKIAKTKMSDKKPMCVDDGGVSFSGTCSYTDSGGEHINNYSCTVTFDAVQDKVSGLIS